MDLVYRKRKRLSRRSWLNVSENGASLSAKPHDRITLNSRGRMTLRLLPGLTLRVKLW